MASLDSQRQHQLENLWKGRFEVKLPIGFFNPLGEA